MSKGNVMSDSRDFHTWPIDTDENTIWFDGWGRQFLLIDPTFNISIEQQTFTVNSLLSFGLVFMKKNRSGWRTDVMYLHNVLKQELSKMETDAID